MLDKKADLAGPGIGNYADLEKVLPQDYVSLLDRKETQRAIMVAKDYIEENMCRELGLMRQSGKILAQVQKRFGNAPSFRMGTPTAVITVRGTRFEVEVNKKNKTVVDVYEGVVAVDMQEIVQSMNPTMEKLLDIPHKSATGARLSSIADLGMQDTLRTGMGRLNQIQKIGFRTVVASRIPIFEHGVQMFLCNGISHAAPHGVFVFDQLIEGIMRGFFFNKPIHVRHHI